MNKLDTLKNIGKKTWKYIVVTIGIIVFIPVFYWLYGDMRFDASAIVPPGQEVVMDYAYLEGSWTKVTALNDEGTINVGTSLVRFVDNPEWWTPITYTEFWGSDTRYYEVETWHLPWGDKLVRWRKTTFQIPFFPEVTPTPT